VVGEVFTHLDLADLEILMDLFNRRAEGGMGKPESWISTVAVLIQKLTHVSTIAVDQFRPITILPWTLKIYMSILLNKVSQYIQPVGFYQFDNRKFHQASEMIHIIRLLVEKSNEWFMPLVLVCVDIRKAFDTIYPSAVEELLNSCNVPLKLKFAIL
jgi:hypothetical protein